jgi:transcriptional regulator with XRE-family HTH domain
MNQTEIKVVVEDKQITLNPIDIRVMLVRRGETFKDLAQRVKCSRENLSRLLNGKANFPFIYQRLAGELSKMVKENKRAA